MLAKWFSKKNRGRLWVGLSLLVLASGAGFAYLNGFFSPAQEESEPSFQTATVRQGDLVVLASGSGTLIAATEVALGFGTNGALAELYVAVGDQVQAGDMLAVQGDREELEAAVASHQLSVMSAQETLDELVENAGMVAAQAQLDLANAQDALEAAERTWQYQQEGYRASSTTIKAAEAELALAEAAMENSKGKYDALSGRAADDPVRAQAYKTYASDYQRYQTALANLNWYTGHPTETQQAQLDAELELAKAAFAAAERAYARVKDGPNPDEVARAELQLANAKAQLAVAERNLDESVIVAPMDGTVMAVEAQIGQTVSGPFITLADLSQPSLEIFLDETDLDKIALGYEVEVVFDALPDQTLTGRVIQVDPTLVTTGNVSTVRGLAELDELTAPGLESLPIGLNAAVDLIGGRAERAVLVPVEALRELSPGEYAVFVVEGGELKLRPVDVGLIDFSFAEILSGLQPGEVVTTGLVETGG